MQNVNNYWFTIEPYVFVGLTDKSVLLYNTLDGVTIESDKIIVIELISELLHGENCGVILLTDERYKLKDINNFITELRVKYMGDVIEVALSGGKPVQLLPYYNFPNKQKVYKKHNFSSLDHVLDNLSQINIHVDATTNTAKLINFLQSIPGNPTFNIIGNIEEVFEYCKILSYFDQHSFPKNIICSYKNVISLLPAFENNFSYRISVKQPIDILKWEYSISILDNQTLPFEYIFDVSSESDCKQMEQLVKQFQIEKYCLNPIYTGDNIHFFEEHVFLTKEDILSTPMTIKDFFSRQMMNIYDFGKINIMPNGDAYANLNHPRLGNIETHSIYEIVQKEIEKGESWFNIRTQEPCCKCVYQWLCPSPSNYEIAIGRSDLCHVR